MAGHKRKRSADDMGDSTPAQEQSLAELQFGHLYEGLDVSPGTSPAEHAELTARYLSRRHLASFAFWPEGYGVTVGADASTGEGGRSFVLLTPPEYAPVLAADGTWTRVLRDEQVHGAAPYTVDWYQEYLDRNALPRWFLTAGHLAMLQERTESLLLGAQEGLEAPLPPRGDGHLALAAGQRYLLPVPCGSSLRLNSLSHQQRQMLISHFPALAITYIDHVVVIHPSGHVHLRSATSAADALNGMLDRHINAQAYQWHIPSPQPSAFFRQPAPSGNIPATGDGDTMVRPSNAARATAVENAQRAGGIVNPDYAMRGLGHWEWLQPYDARLAGIRGIVHQGDTVDMRVVGLLARGTGPNADPSVVWYSDPDFLNPAARPGVPGRWEYQTDEARDWAIQNLGDEYGLPARPSAREIWNLRRESALTGTQDVTTDINVLWIPGEQDEAATPLASPSPPTGAVLDGDDSDNVVDGALETSSAEPTNGTGLRGENDQTGTAGKADHYATRLEDGRWIVIDQSAPEVGREEPHLFRIFTKAGLWLTYLHSQNFNWDDAKSCKKLKAWREQHSRRGVFGKKRDDKRVDYTHEQRKWVGEVYKDAKAKYPSAIRPEGGLRKFTDLFNKKFGKNEQGLLREVAGITTMFDRVRKEIDEHGEVQEKKGRGWTQKAKGAQIAKTKAKAGASKTPTKAKVSTKTPAKKPGKDQKDNDEESEEDSEDAMEE